MSSASRMLPCALRVLSLLRGLVWCAGFACAVSAAASTPFLTPDPAELSMTTLSGHPSASAVVLYREEMQDDTAGKTRHYERIKVLSDAGRKYASVELQYSDGEDGEQINDIVARTIHPDGKIIPFTDKPYKKTILNGKDGYRLQQITFTLPEVEVGSIIEYSYVVHFEGRLVTPSWALQGALYIRLEQFFWKKGYSSGYGPTALSMLPNLPPGAILSHKYTGQPGVFVNQKSWDARSTAVIAKDVSPLPDLEFMPPLDSVRFNVHFSYVYAGSPKEFWDSNGTSWSKSIDEFIKPSDELTRTAVSITAGATNPADKLRKIYAFIMSLENTDDTRARNKQENKVEGHKNIKSINDILDLKRGNSFSMTALFVALARAAGLQAYMMLVPNRAIELFNPDYLSFDQFDDVIAIVNADGKDTFFDPGTRYCAYGHLAWQHTFVRGLRQSSTTSMFAATPNEDAHANVTVRSATLRVDEQGSVSGVAKISLSGSPALVYRQIALRSDEAEMRQRMKDSLGDELPKTLQADITGVENLRDYEKPLVFSASLQGTLGAQAGKRRIYPADFFTSRDEVIFTAAERPLSVYFHYPEIVEDDSRLLVPPNTHVEVVPEAKKLQAPGLAYVLSATALPDSFVSRRILGQGNVMVTVKDYGALHDFFKKSQNADKETVVVEGLAKAKTTSPTP